MDWGSSYSSGFVAIKIASENNEGLRDESLNTCTSNNILQCSKDGPMPIVTAAKACNDYSTSTKPCMFMKFY